MLIAAVSLQWVAIFLACMAIESALIPATLAITAIFVAQLVTSWRLFTIVGNPNSWQRLDMAGRRPYWYAAFGLFATGALGTIAAFLLWTLS